MKTFLLPALALLAFAGCAHVAILDQPLPHVTGIHEAGFRQEMGALVGLGLVGGNRIETLENGREIFPAMLAAIRGARQSVNFETFVFEEGEVPRAFAEALAAKARQGVPVRVILDAHGSKKARAYHQAMREAGVQLELYHPIFWLDVRRYNRRTHRKLLIVDGRVGFIGGVGIADPWDGDATRPEEWRDLHYRVRGPVVAALQSVFNDNWLEVRGELLQGAAYFPPLAPAGGALASVFPSTPVRDRSSAVELMYHLAIASARRSLLIENAYFVPNHALVEALCAAARRGVRVRIILPGDHIDQKSVRRASRKRWPRLLAAGVELYEFEPTMIHSKLLIADDLFVSVGSANFDPRSLRINDEANLNVLDADFAAAQRRVFLRDLARAKRVKPEDGGTKLHEVPVQAAQTPLESQL